MKTLSIILSMFQTAVRPQHSLAAQQYLLQTKDGAATCIRHYQGEGEPVLIAHGITSNLNFWDMRKDRSLAVYLHQQGYDVWLSSFRGHDCAKINVDGKPQQSGWTIDHYGKYDLDAVIEHITENSKQNSLHFVAHSLGGMALMSYIDTHSDERLSSVSLAGTPGDFADADAALKLAINIGPYSPSSIPTDQLAKLISILPITPFENLIYSKTHRNFTDHRDMLSTVAGPTSRGEIEHMLQTFELGYFAPFGETRSHLVTIEQATTPLLLIAGRADHIAPVDRVYRYYQHWGGAKTFVIAGREYGFKSDYGHCDVSMGEKAPEEIYPLILRQIKSTSSSQ